MNNESTEGRHAPYNPKRVSPEASGTDEEGYRLLDRDEVLVGSPCLREVESWYPDGWEACASGSHAGSTYRTKLTREELRAARGLLPEPVLQSNDATPLLTTASEEKLRQTILYICNRSKDDPHFDLKKLKYLLFNCDMEAYLKTGKPITDLTYVKGESELETLPDLANYLEEQPAGQADPVQPAADAKPGEMIDWLAELTDAAARADSANASPEESKFQWKRFDRAIAAATSERDSLRAENAELRIKWESYAPGRPGHMYRGLCDLIARLTDSIHSSKPPSCHVQELFDRLTAAESREKRLREALEEIATWPLHASRLVQAAAYYGMRDVAIAALAPQEEAVEAQTYSHPK